ncbi:hypothetical protein ACIBKY_33370 [Nonomuraea sp. NPDC050394]|uniref:hypothetical protein n=1 Tax=Nonomuraea sp. NPDC050394 TaxID=3364363 RepID=UPI0037BCE8AC
MGRPDQTLHDLAEYAVAAREIGALHFLPQALTHRAAVHVYAGHFDAAVTLIEKSDAILRVTGKSHTALEAGYTSARRRSPKRWWSC